MVSREERIAHLKASAQAERLAAEVAIFEARGQLAPLRSAAGVVRLAVRAFSPTVGAGGLIVTGSKYLIGRPWLASALMAGAMRLLRRHPVALLLALASGAAAWWLFRPTAGPAGEQRERG